MIKYKETIEKLTFDQKIKLVSNLITWDSSFINDFPNIKIKNIKDVSYGEGEYFLSPEKISSCWDNSLLEEYYELVGKVANKQNINILTGANGNILNQNGTFTRLAEDETLVSGSLNSYINGLSQYGILPVVDNYSFNESSLAYIDKEFNERAARDSYLKPFQNICKNPNKFLVKIDNSVYGDENTSQIIDILYKDFNYNTLLLSDKFIELKQKLISLNDDNCSLNEEQVDEIIDELLSQILDNKIDIDEEEVKDTEIESLLYKVIINSTVLLKNENFLPIKYKYNLSIVLNNENLNIDVDSFKFKYHNCGDIRITNKQNAQSDVQNGDVVLFFISNSEIENGMISSNDTMLLKSIFAKDTNIIGVITNNEVLDTSFDSFTTALIKAPDESLITIKTLLDIIYGKACPCGRSTITYPKNINSITSEIENAKNNALLVGDLIGYRYYDKVNELSKYPFGFGLSYTRFEYSELNCSKDEISFFVKNCGLFESTETIQVYLGVENSFVPRANKHLFTYRCISLKPGEMKKVKIKLGRNAFVSYNANNFKYEVEKGIYDIFVNTSAESTELRGRIAVDGNEFLPLENEKGLEKKLLKSKDKAESKNTKIKTKKSISLPIVISMVLVLLSIAGVVMGVLDKNYILSGICLAIFILDIIILVSLFKNKNKISNDSSNIDDIVADINLDELFKESEIKENLNYDNIKENKQIDTDDKSISYVQYNNDKIEEIYNDLYKIITNKGIVISKDNLKSLLLGMASSKVLIIKNNNQELFNKLSDVFNIYFNSELFSCTTFDENTKTNGIFKNNDETYNSLYKAIMYTAKYENQISFVPLAGINKDNISLLSEIIDDCKYARVDTMILMDNKSLLLPKNLWYLISFDDDIKELDPSILEYASVINVELGECEANTESNIISNVDYYSFIYLIKNIKTDISISEDNYKKLDSLEEYVNKYKKFKFDNKYYKQIEEILSVDLMLKCDDIVALDDLLTIKIMPLIATILDDVKLEDEDNINNQLDLIFGETNIEQTMKLLDKMNKKAGL